MICAALSLLAALSPAAAATDVATLEREGEAYVLREYERIGRASPRPDRALQGAARALAREALRTGADQAADFLKISAYVSDSGGADPSPRAVVIRATPAAYALESFVRRTDFNQEPATHLGVGAVVEGDRAVLVALLAERKSNLRPFPRALKRPGERLPLCGELERTYHRPEIFITRPGGDVEHVPLSRQSGSSFCATLAFPAAGQHAVEVLARGQRGPEVAALFYVDVGAVRPQARASQPPEPTTVAEARAAILLRINALREAHGAAAVAGDPALDAVAQAYAERMVRERFFAHVAPDGEDLRGRLTAAGYAYRQAGENLGMASGPLGAHFAVEHSPGHRKNLLEPDYRAAGVGVAFDRSREQPQALVVEILALPTPPAVPEDPLEAAYRAVDRLRAEQRLPPLRRSEALERIAASHVRQALEHDSPKPELPGSRVHDRVFDALGSVTAAAVDLFVAADPGALPKSRNVADARNAWVGVGAVKGSSPTYGKEKYWVVVIYAATR